MTREEFIEILKERGYYYKLEVDKIIVCRGYKNDVDFHWLKTLPSDVVFENGGGVNLNGLKTLPPGVEFKNGGTVFLDRLETLTPDVEFNNLGSVWLGSLKTLPTSVEFNHGGYVRMPSGVGSWLWDGNIEGVDSKRLLNFMISKGMFI